jgi:hypothetical protein
MKRLKIISRVKATIFFNNFLLTILAYVRSIHVVSLILGAGFIIYPTFWHIVIDMFNIDLLDSANNNILCDSQS